MFGASELRDHAMVAMLIGCGLLRAELWALRLESIQQREEHWIIADLVGKAGHVRTVPIPTRAATTRGQGRQGSRTAQCAARSTRLGASGEKGRILLRDDLSLIVEFSVLVHAVVRELLHASDRCATTTKTVCETEAEAVASVVSDASGLDTSTAAADYMQLHSVDKETLLASLALIQGTDAEILHAIHVNPGSGRPSRAQTVEVGPDHSFVCSPLEGRSRQPDNGGNTGAHASA